LIHSIERRLERVAEAISGRNSGCTCDGQGSVRVVRFVGLGDPLEEPGEPGEWRPRCPIHRLRIRFERFDRPRGAYVEFDPKKERG
jgi:hypothetical protein